ncbi:hypothetical protein CSC2_35410 [Clostridium zeae]|uniref:Stage 0 sporulation protein A homolog n=1 Tax=Clostridium zeae TaxID=2759022 RepID=A0ABQ1EEJ4_9CLOT|nr:response regulator [Clostridium zeae]GFZ33015.1 hypothetical protein CSC2_35410 [Clostridium zeae]
MYSVMIVDDMKIIRMQIKRLKIWGEKSGFSIMNEAGDGVEAIKSLEANAIDLVITDIKMPKMDGIELLEEIIKRNLCSCVVLLSDYTEFDYARKAFTIGAFDYLGKPVDEAEFLKVLGKVNNYLAKRKQQEENLKKLEEIASEKIKFYYSTHQIDEISELINSGDMKAIEYVEKLFQGIANELDYNLAKLSVVLEKLLVQIVDKVTLENHWLKKVRDVNQFKNIQLLKYDELSLMEHIFIQNFRQLIDVIIQFTHSNQSNNNIKLVCKYVLENIDNEISIKLISEKLFITRTYLSEIFSKNLGISIKKYLNMVRMERAKNLIKMNNLKSYEVANKLGFKDIEYFSKVFKQYTSMTPTEYKNNTTL